MSIADSLGNIYTSLNSVLSDCNDALVDKGQEQATTLNGIAPLISQVTTGAGIQLTVIAPENTELSVGDGGTSYVVFVDESGEYTFDLPRGGEWTVTATLNGASKTEIVNIATNYMVTLSAINR